MSEQEKLESQQLESDKKVLYSVSAVEHILEAVLDDEFFKLTGGYKMPSIALAIANNQSPQEVLYKRKWATRYALRM